MSARRESLAFTIISDGLLLIGVGALLWIALNPFAEAIFDSFVWTGGSSQVQDARRFTRQAWQWSMTVALAGGLIDVLLAAKRAPAG